MIKETTKNNWRALGIHFALSIIGFISFVLLSLFTYSIFPDIQGVPYWTELPLFLTPIIGGSFIYIFCGYRFLKPTKENPVFSALWLMIMTTLAVIASLNSGMLDVSSSHALLFANLLGFAILSLFTMENGFLSFHVSSLALILFVSLLPSGLLCLGLRLKIWREGKAVTTELDLSDEQS